VRSAPTSSGSRTLPVAADHARGPALGAMAPRGPSRVGRRGGVRVARALRVLLVAVAALALVPLWSVGATALEPVRSDGPVRIVPQDGALIEVDGTRYHGTIELAADGQVVNEVSVERYLEGVAEMPSRWPSAALEAQAVAARTYAWWSASNAVHDGYDICATTACQVYRGAEVVLDGGQRWAEAVAATAGEVLLDADGGPILARYFSTSGGRTYANDEVFPSTGARPYLAAIDDPFDAASPYHRWEVAFDRADFDALLAEGQQLSAVVPVASVTRTGPVDDVSARLRFVGADGTEVVISPLAVRDFLNLVAPARFPDRYPSRRADGFRPLPSTVPSTRFTVRVDDDEVVLLGRGWGHGVGLGQYGARGRADAGQDHATILAAYYGGLEPTRSPRLPGSLRVGLGRRAEVRVAVDGAARLETVDGAVVRDRLVGAWVGTTVDGGWRLDPPEVADGATVVGPTREVGALLGTPDAVTVEADVAVGALLSLEVTDLEGREVLVRPLGLAAPGAHGATWRLEDAGGGLVEPGTYRVTLVGEDAAGQRGGTGVEVTVEPSAVDASTNPWGPGALASGTLSALLAGPGSWLVALTGTVLLVLIVLRVRANRSRP